MFGVLYIYKVCVFDLVHVYGDNLSLHFYNQSEINLKDDTEWGHLNKIKDTDFIVQIFVVIFLNIKFLDFSLIVFLRS